MTKKTRTKEAALSNPASGADLSRNSGDGRTLYVLGFGIAGAILADAILLIYFASL